MEKSNEVKVVDPHAFEAAFTEVAKELILDYNPHAHQDAGEAFTTCLERWAEEEFVE